MKPSLTFVLSLGCVTPILLADERLPVERGIPLEISEADPIPHRSRNFSFFSRYENTAADRDYWSLVSRMRYGIARDWEVSVELPLQSGRPNAGNGIGDLRIEALYQFLSERRFFPSASVFGALSLPTAQGSQGWDPTIGILASRNLGLGGLDHRLHFNFSFHHNAKADNQRDNCLKLLVGYDLRIGADTLLLVDFIREEESDRRLTSNMVEIGIRREFNRDTTVGAGFGIGLDDQSPDFRVTLGLQRVF